jgi:hypothetical protein
MIPDRLRKINAARGCAHLARGQDLDDEPKWRQQVLDGFKVRARPEQRLPGKFVHPHDACFDQDRNTFVTECVQTGRVPQAATGLGGQGRPSGCLRCITPPPTPRATLRAPVQR